jgi:hypothetical protein
MRVSVTEKNHLSSELIALLDRLVQQVPWPQRRQSKADIVDTLLNGEIRAAEDIFGWGRNGIAIGRGELQSGKTHEDKIAARRKPSTEEKFPEIERDIHLLFDSKSQADSRLNTTLRYLNASAANVREALIENGYSDAELPTERTINNLLNRMGFRLYAVQKAKPQKKRLKPI